MSGDEKIRKEIVRFIQMEVEDEIVGNKWLAWLEKQKSVEENKIIKRIKTDIATSLINYINANSKGMYLSDIECEDIEDAIINNKWYKVYNYMKKELEKQEEKPQGKSALEAANEEKVDNANKVEPKDYSSIDPLFFKTTDKVEPKFKVKYAGGEYNVLEIKEFPGGIIYYGIEDEPNHIDYILPENCEIISGYGVKEKGNSYPTKSATFSQQNPVWSEEDDYNVQCLAAKVTSDIQNGNVGRNQELIDWLKSIKDRVQPQPHWKPSEEQIQCLYDAIEHYHTNGYPASKLNELYEQMSKIYKL